MIVFGSLLLSFVGLVMVSSASSWLASRQGAPYSYLVKQFIWVALGGVGMFVASRIPMATWRDRLVTPLLVVSLVLNFAVVVPGNPFAVTVKGATRWLGGGWLTFQPSELAKLALVMFLASLFWRRPGDLTNPSDTVHPACVVFGLFGLTTFVQDDMGTTLLLGLLLVTLMWLGGVPVRWVFGAVGGMATVGALFVLFREGFRLQRLLAFLDPSAHADGAAYQMLQSRIGLATGGIFGVGLGDSKVKWGFVPMAHSDFIVSVIGEELGLLGVLMVIVLLMCVVGGGIRAGLRTTDRFSRLTAFGICSWFTVQAAVNIGVAAGALPTKGITLPFVSYGGSSLVITMFATGVLLRIAREAESRT